jgi:diguanylate cyclase (GGDEF)-like protein
MRILVADDSKTSLAAITMAIKKLGHDVVTASSGEQAVELFQRERPDLVILDVVMQPMDGFECATRIRQLAVDDWIPIIFLSASVDDASIAKGIDAGGDDYLTKPFSDITLAAKIKAMQRIADMRQKLFETSQKLFLLSSTDPLTGIYNRLQFERSIREIISAADRYNHMMALLFIDLDNFKGVNDTFGHHTGDLLLVEVAKRLKSNLRSNDFISRLGGDEFAVILTEIEKPEQAGQVAQNIITSLAFDYHLEDRFIRNGASVGIACYPFPGTHRDNIILNADIAMYHAKATGRNNYQYFTEELQERYKQQLNLEYALKFALERNEFYLTYQPIYDLQTKKVSSFEALICWDHPKFGLVSPSTFIPIAEEAGLIGDIGDWVLEQSCKEFRGMLDKNENISLCINISSRQLVQENFYSRVKEVIKEFNIPPERLIFELTESAIMSYSDGPFKSTINKIHDYGIKVSIDDFGTGYSSLIRLKHLPIHTLKIETSFVQDAVRDVNGAIIVSCLIALGKNLDLNVVAEGIETDEQLQFLIGKGCPQGQGFYLNKPFKCEEAIKLLEKDEVLKTK